MKHKGVSPINLSSLEQASTSTLEKRIHSESATMTPKSLQIAAYVMENPQKAVFMTTRQLASAAKVSEATVVRFVRQLGYQSYAVFIRQLRDHIDSTLTLMDRGRIAKTSSEKHQTPLSRVVAEEIENLSMLLNHIDMDVAEKVVDSLHHAHRIIVVGSRLSYSLACYLGWTLTKVRTDILIRSGSDRSTIDWMAIAPEKTVVVMVAMSRYPNELIRIGKMARRLGHDLIVLADGNNCPLIQFSTHALVSPLQSIPFLGSITSLSCLINYLVHALADKQGEALVKHQERLEQVYLENDILFNLDPRTPNT